MTVTPLHREIVLEHPDIDDGEDYFASLIVRIRDENDRGINVNFECYLIYRKTNESWALDHEAFVGCRASGHWLCEIRGMEFLEGFKKT